MLLGEVLDVLVLVEVLVEQRPIIPVQSLEYGGGDHPVLGGPEISFLLLRNELDFLGGRGRFSRTKDISTVRLGRIFRERAEPRAERVVIFWIRSLHFGLATREHECIMDDVLDMRRVHSNRPNDRGHGDPVPEQSLLGDPELVRAVVDAACHSGYLSAEVRRSAPPLLAFTGPTKVKGTRSLPSRKNRQAPRRFLVEGPQK
ncbi:hypothetical protein [Polyangium sp. 6x1]|uniref:hypothetical protein n=1 Tax=Polyangium sp. 6x1 TaxID=3042689 RepID=UPI002482E114|nr:hypothetical protein [Polyangium sp. 6x1]MDI1451880.1 hypothetical protein [Polyangium sp. 6x1]